MTDMVQVTIDNEWEVIHGLSTVIFIFDLGPFPRSRSKSCTFVQ